MKEYTYRTDGELGAIVAEDFADACRQLDAKITRAALLDGGWAWVDDCDGIERPYEIGPLPVEILYPED